MREVFPSDIHEDEADTALIRCDTRGRDGRPGTERAGEKGKDRFAHVVLHERRAL